MAAKTIYPPPPPYERKVQDPKSTQQPFQLQGATWNTHAPRIFHVYNSTFHYNYEVLSDDKAPLFYGKTSIFSRTLITLHGGNNKNGPVLGVAKRPFLDTDVKLGLGDPQNARDMVWEDMTRETIMTHSTYGWQATVYPNGPDSNGKRKSFLWKRTHSVGIDDSSPSIFSDMNFKLVDAQTNEVVAVFANNGPKSFSKKGKLQINENYGPAFDKLVVLSVLALIEKARRRRSAGSGGGGGGGGGSG